MAVQPDWLEPLSALVGEFPGGMVCLVGAGPGDSTLISVRGAVRLMQADVVLHDKLVGADLLALASPDAERVFVGKWRGRHVWKQEEINDALVRLAQQGKRVVRLKGGDPFVFGRGGEECQALAREGIPFEVVPGIPAAFGAPATAGIPLTHRGLSRSFALVTGHADPRESPALDFAALARMDTTVFYMGVKNLVPNCEGLIAAGMDPQTPVAVIQSGTQPDQRTIIGTLADIGGRAQAAGVVSPAMIVVGQVVGLREKLAWFEHRPLFGQTVAVTRGADQAAMLTGALRAAGARVIAAPTIAIADIADHAVVDQALARLQQYAWLVLTSVNGVDALFARLAAGGHDSRRLAGPKIAAVGAATADRLLGQGIKADLIPEEAVGEALAAAMVAEGLAGNRVLLLRGDLAGGAMVRKLEEAGAVCDDLVIYRTVRPQALPADFLTALRAGAVDWIVFTSPSCLVNLWELLEAQDRDRLRAAKLASIGPVTSQAIRKKGLEPAAEAEPHGVAGLVAAMIRRQRQT